MPLADFHCARAACRCRAYAADAAPMIRAMTLLQIVYLPSPLPEAPYLPRYCEPFCLSLPSTISAVTLPFSPPAHAVLPDHAAFFHCFMLSRHAPFRFLLPLMPAFSSFLQAPIITPMRLSPALEHSSPFSFSYLPLSDILLRSIAVSRFLRKEPPAIAAIFQRH